MTNIQVSHKTIIEGSCRCFCVSPIESLSERCNEERNNSTCRPSTIIQTNYIERVTASTAAAATAAAAEVARKVANPSLQVEPQIQFALALDLGRRPRMNRSGTTQIVVHKQKKARQVERLMIVTTEKLNIIKSTPSKCNNIGK